MLQGPQKRQHFEARKGVEMYDLSPCHCTFTAHVTCLVMMLQVPVYTSTQIHYRQEDITIQEVSVDKMQQWPSLYSTVPIVLFLHDISDHHSTKLYLRCSTFLQLKAVFVIMV